MPRPWQGRGALLFHWLNSSGVSDQNCFVAINNGVPDAAANGLHSVTNPPTLPCTGPGGRRGAAGHSGRGIRPRSAAFRGQNAKFHLFRAEGRGRSAAFRARRAERHGQRAVLHAQTAGFRAHSAAFRKKRAERDRQSAEFHGKSAEHRKKSAAFRAFCPKARARSRERKRANPWSGPPTLAAFPHKPSIGKPHRQRAGCAPRSYGRAALRRPFTRPAMASAGRRPGSGTSSPACAIENGGCAAVTMK